MSEEIDPLVIQRTQQKLGKYIQRPQLTDKLLRRPPFRFIHDIITAAISQYSVLENVFTKQELVSENIKEKEEKINFLKKFIQHISSELGEDLNVKPSKIVAGIEAERTNDLLQALALMLENKQNNKSQQKNPQLGKDSKNSDDAHTPNKTAKTSNGINKPPPVIKKNVPSNNVTKENTSSKPTAKIEGLNKQAPAKTKDVTKTGVNSKTISSTTTKPTPGMPNKVTAKSEDAKRENNGASSKKPENLNKTLKQTPTVSAKTSSRLIKETLPPPRLLDAQENYNLILDESPPDYPNVDEEPLKSKTHLDDVMGSEKSLQVSPDFPSIDSGITIEHSDTSNIKIRPLKAPVIRQAQDEGFGADEMETQETLGTPSSRIAQLSPPQSNILNAFEKPIPNRSSSPNVPLKRPSSGNSSHRPKSSRRPPSRTIRDRLSVIPQDNRPMTGQVPRVIIEGNSMSDDEEDRIVQAAVFDQATADLSQAGADELLGGEQGKLVEQILSAQREWDPLTDTEPGNKGGSTLQLQHLKANIQEMAQAALPLGQLIPLIHEDMETVLQEWQFWKKEANILEEEYHREKTSVDSVVDKLQVELEQLNRMVLEHQARLNTAKASVLKTEKDVSLVISNFGKKR